MPLVFERDFRVRHYECDAYGHVNNVNYLRYMQEAALDASAAAGYDLARYDELGTRWLVRETEIEFFSPLRYGDSVVVRTWVADFRRVRSRRMYALFRVSDGERVAQAHSDWVYLDQQSGQPLTVPPEMAAAFLPEGATAAPLPRPAFPEAPPPPEGAFHMRRQVLWQDVDAAGHVNNVEYLVYVSDCGFEVAAAHGWTADRMQAAGFGIVVRRLHVEYRQPARLGDELDIATWWYHPRRVAATRVYRIRRAGDGALLAQAQGQYVWVNLASGEPIRIPAEFLADLAPNRAA